MKTSWVFAVALLLGAILACGKSAPTISGNPVDPANDPLYKTIHAMPNDTTKLRLLTEYTVAYAADRTCTDTDQCRTMPLGFDYCGVRAYLIYSAGAVDETAVQALGRELSSVSAAVYGDDWPARVCPAKPGVIFPVPRVGCVDGQCARVP